MENGGFLLWFMMYWMKPLVLLILCRSRVKSSVMDHRIPKCTISIHRIYFSHKILKYLNLEQKTTQTKRKKIQECQRRCFHPSAKWLTLRPFLRTGWTVEKWIPPCGSVSQKTGAGVLSLTLCDGGGGGLNSMSLGTKVQVVSKDI